MWQVIRFATSDANNTHIGHPQPLQMYLKHGFDITKCPFLGSVIISLQCRLLPYQEMASHGCSLRLLNQAKTMGHVWSVGMSSFDNLFPIYMFSFDNPLVYRCVLSYIFSWLDLSWDEWNKMNNFGKNKRWFHNTLLGVYTVCVYTQWLWCELQPAKGFVSVLNLYPEKFKGMGGHMFSSDDPLICMSTLDNCHIFMSNFDNPLTFMSTFDDPLI